MEKNDYETPKRLWKKASVNIVCNQSNGMECSPMSNQLSTIKLNTNKTCAFTTLPVIETPPPRTKKIINPFDTILPERLRLPFINSPLLVQKGISKPNNQFEWSIDDLSLLKPANVQVNEAQFSIQTDPVLEAEAQEAIRLYFKASDIVPSPEDRQPMLQQRLVMLGKCSNNNSFDEIYTNKRDNTSQTMLSFPPKLPKNVEDIIAPYFTYDADQQTENKYSDNYSKDKYDEQLAETHKEMYDRYTAAFVDSYTEKLTKNKVSIKLSPSKMLTPEMPNNKIPISVKRFSVSPFTENNPNESFSMTECSLSPINNDSQLSIQNSGQFGSGDTLIINPDSSSEMETEKSTYFSKSEIIQYLNNKNDSSANDVMTENAETASSPTNIENTDAEFSQSSYNKIEYSTTPFRKRSEKNRKASRKNLSQSFNFYVRNQILDESDNTKCNNDKGSLDRMDSGFTDFHINFKGDKPYIIKDFESDVSMNSNGPKCSTPTKK